MTTTDTIKGKINEAEEMARKIWLAGLGAYGTVSYTHLTLPTILLV